MKLRIKENAIDIADLKQTLTEEFEGKYQISKRNKMALVVSKDKMIGAIVTVTKNRIFVVGNFPTLKIQILSTLLFIFLGILIPLIIYFLVFHKKMKFVEKDVAAFIKENYPEGILK